MELSELVKEFAREKHSQKGLNMHDKELWVPVGPEISI
jgi:hypothetical protein